DYAVICCQTAYLKAHYPVEYITALLTVDHHDTEKVAKYVTDARQLGITVAPPSINRAMLDFTIEDGQREIKRLEIERVVQSPSLSVSKSPGSNLQSSRSLIRYGLAAIKNAG